MIYLTADDLLHICEQVIGVDLMRDRGLLESAAFRPQASAFGEDAYPTVEMKAAALMHSVAMNHALIDGNKRLALAATIAFLGMNGRRLTLTNDEAYDLVISIAAGAVRDVESIADVIASGSEARP